MVFVMGGCYLLPSPTHHTFFPSPSCYTSSSSSSSSSQSICFFSPLKMARNGRSRKVSASMNQEGKNGGNLCARKVFLFVGFSVLPVLRMTAMTLESLASDASDLKASELDQRAEKKHEGDASGNPFVTVLSGLGILGSGVLTALYWMALKEKANSEATIESMRDQLKKKEATIVSMKKKFELDLMNEKEVINQQVMKVHEEQNSLISQLNSANDTIVGLRQELRKEIEVVEVLQVSIDGLQNDLVKAGKDNEELQEKINFRTGEIKEKEDNLQIQSSALADKEMQLEKLSITNRQLQDRLAGLSSENEGLKDKLLKNSKELELKMAAIDDLNAQIGVLRAEKDKSTRKFDSIQREYDNLKSSSGKKAAEDAKLLEDQARTVHQIEQQLESTSSELSRSKLLVADLSEERDDLRKMLDIELNNVKSLEKDVQMKHENLETSKNLVSEFARQLQQSRDLCFKLEAEVSKVRAGYAEARESLQKTTEEAKRSAEVLARELILEKELLKKKTEEVENVSHELAAVTQSRDDLQEELVDVCKKAETAANELLEEKASVASLKKELKAFEAQISEETEARKSLEKDLEDAVRSLDEMINQNASIPSRELEFANTQIWSIEDERDALYKSLAEQKQVSQEARENMEDAHSLIMRLGQEKETFEKRAKKLGDELASAKGEILQLRSQMNSSKTVVRQQKQTAVPARKTGRRGKSVGKQDEPE